MNTPPDVFKLRGQNSSTYIEKELLTVGARKNALKDSN